MRHALRVSALAPGRVRKCCLPAGGCFIRRRLPRELADIAARPVALDLMGLNFYPQWSAKSVCLDSRGRVAYRIPDPSGAGFEMLLDDHYRRYGCPIMVTETSAHGSPKVRAE
jgi:hypothetical protein